MKGVLSPLMLFLAQGGLCELKKKKKKKEEENTKKRERERVVEEDFFQD